MTFCQYHTQQCAYKTHTYKLVRKENLIVLAPFMNLRPKYIFISTNTYLQHSTHLVTFSHYKQLGLQFDSASTEVSFEEKNGQAVESIWRVLPK